MTSDANRTLVIEKELPHPPAKVWRALTETDLMKNWLLDNDFQPTVGHRFRFRTHAMPDWDGTIESEVLTLEPHQKLSYRWNALGLTSVVTWTLTPTPRGTLLRMEQTGFRPDQKNEFGGAKYGWQSFIAKLELVVSELP